MYDTLGAQNAISVRPEQATKAQRGVDLELYSFFNLGARWSGWSTPRPGRFNPRGRPGIHCRGGWMGSRAGLDRCGKSRPPPGFDLRTVHPVASTTKAKHNILEKV